MPSFTGTRFPAIFRKTSATVLPTFANQSETTAIVSALTTAGITPSTGRIRSYDQWVRKLKLYGIWAKLSGSNCGLWMLCQDSEAGALVNLCNPGTNNLVKNGTPTFTATSGATSGGSTSNFYSTGIPLSAINHIDHSMAVHTATTGTNTTAVMGALSGANGMLLNPKSSASGAVMQSMGPTSGGITPGSAWDMDLTGFSRNGTADFNAHHMSRLVAAVTNTGAAIASATTITICKVNGGSGASSRVVNWAFVGLYLTPAQFTELFAATKTLQECIQYAGDVEYLEAGYQPQNLTADIVIYGATAGGVAAAVNAKRAGRTVALVGGWRDYQIGGMMTGGLGATDFTSSDAVLGTFTVVALTDLITVSASHGLAIGDYVRVSSAGTLPGGMAANTTYFVKTVPTGTTLTVSATMGGATLDITDIGSGTHSITKKGAAGGWTRDRFDAVRTAQGLGTTSLQVDCRFFLYELRARLAAAGIPVYRSTGLASVQTSGRLVTGFTTRDGRVFTGSMVMDMSYEGDLMRRAGCAYVYGREQASGSGPEAKNGWRGIETGETQNQYRANGGAVAVSPRLTEDNDATGLLPGIQLVPVGLTQGDADSRTMNYNFRMAWTTAADTRLPFSATPPAGYNALLYETLFRMAAKVPAIVIADTITLNTATGIIDRNNGGAVSTNYMGGIGTDTPGSDEYVAAVIAGDYAAMEVAWKKHETWPRGLMYALAQDPDARMTGTTTLRTTWATYGESMLHHLDHHPNDAPHWPTQLYIRAGLRLAPAVGQLTWNGDDIDATDGTTPRSTKTIAVASYTMDSHHNCRYVDVSTTPDRIWNSGLVSIPSSGGTDHRSPIPLEIFLPTEFDNLFVGYCPRMTAIAYGAYRMEFTFMQVGASGAMVCSRALTDGSTLWNVDYNAVRADIFALPDSNPAVLPQLN